MNAETTHVAHSHPPYVKIYLILLLLFAISVAGPTLGIPAVTLIAAFGIAVVKAAMVAAYFMHLNIEERYVWYVLLVMLAFIGLLFAGVAPDVLSQAGQNWRHLAVEPPPPPAH